MKDKIFTVTITAYTKRAESHPEAKADSRKSHHLLLNHGILRPAQGCTAPTALPPAARPAALRSPELSIRRGGTAQK